VIVIVIVKIFTIINKKKVKKNTGISPYLKLLIKVVL
jgi:hypothetical protein